MAKRKARTPVERVPRKEPYSRERLEAVAERLRTQCDRLGNLARELQEAVVGEIEIDGHAMLLRGMNQIDNFLDNASRALREARISHER